MTTVLKTAEPARSDRHRMEFQEIHRMPKPYGDKTPPAPIALKRRQTLRVLAAGSVAISVGGKIETANAADVSASGTVLPPEGQPQNIDPGGDYGQPHLVSDFPEKGEMLLFRREPALLETPFSVFRGDVFTPNNRFFVRWHLAGLPPPVDVPKFRLVIRGHVRKQISLELLELMTGFERVEIAAVCQAPENSRSFFSPPVSGTQWGNGAMGNAKWAGVRLSDLLYRAGIRGGSRFVRFNGMDNSMLPSTPDYIKSLSLPHALQREVIVAYEMNGTPLPIMNGFPLRLVVPGWYSTYWIKMLNDIEVLDHPDNGFWMTHSYLVPNTPGADMKPGSSSFKMVPVGPMVPRSFFTNVASGTQVKVGQAHSIEGIAFGGATALARVMVSADAGQTWNVAQLGADHGPFSFRQWRINLTARKPGSYTLVARAFSEKGETQPLLPNWNDGGFMRNVVETVQVTAIA
jgi:DMSO/TMAO reductase YedYZ molybdopterin-dependent catalytic subunit